MIMYELVTGQVILKVSPGIFLLLEQGGQPEREGKL